MKNKTKFNKKSSRYKIRKNSKKRNYHNSKSTTNKDKPFTGFLQNFLFGSLKGNYKGDLVIKSSLDMSKYDSNLKSKSQKNKNKLLD